MQVGQSCWRILNYIELNSEINCCISNIEKFERDVGYQQIFFSQQSMMYEGPRIHHPNCCQITWQLPAPDSNSCLFCMESWFIKNSGGVPIAQKTQPFRHQSSSLDRTWAKCRSLIFIFLASTRLQPPLREMMTRCDNIMNTYLRKQQRAHVFKYCTGFIQIACSGVLLHALWIEMSVRLGYKTRPIFEAKITRVTSRAATKTHTFWLVALPPLKGNVYQANASFAILVETKDWILWPSTHRCILSEWLKMVGRTVAQSAARTESWKKSIHLQYGLTLQQMELIFSILSMASGSNSRQASPKALGCSQSVATIREPDTMPNLRSWYWWYSVSQSASRGWQD